MASHLRALIEAETAARELTDLNGHSLETELAYYRARLERMLAETDYCDPEFVKHTKECVEDYSDMLELRSEVESKP